MAKERGIILLLLFLLFQVPIVFFFAKTGGSFDELKGKIALAELGLVALFVIALSLRRRSLSQGPVLEEPKVEKAFGALSNESAVLEKQCLLLEKERDELKKKGVEQEKNIALLEEERDAQALELGALRQRLLEENSAFFKKQAFLLGDALFTQLEKMEELRRQHMIEMRALLKKESTVPFEKKTALAMVPRGGDDPTIFLALLEVFSQRLSQASAGKGEVRALVRRKFFDELRGIKTLPCLCLSMETPSENLIPSQYQADEMKRVMDVIRQKEIAVGPCTYEIQGIPWIIVRLREPFFQDIFLCLRSD